jgi:membrane protease YdiL (CAAX protease family)
MSVKTRLFLILFTAGFVGVLSFLLIDLAGLVAMVPVPPGTEVLKITLGLRFLALVQPTILLLVATIIGVALATKVELFAPFAEAAARRTSLSSAIRPQIVPGIIGGVAGGGAIALLSAFWKPFPPEGAALVAKFGNFVPLPTRLLYGGITEELLLRWGFMTLILWVSWRLFQKGQGKPKPAYFVAAILISSVVFGLGHLPVAKFLFPQLTAALVAYVLVANSLFGLIAGCLYWRKGLESAMIAHMVAHLVMFTATYLAA